MFYCCRVMKWILQCLFTQLNTNTVCTFSLDSESWLRHWTEICSLSIFYSHIMFFWASFVFVWLWCQSAGVQSHEKTRFVLKRPRNSYVPPNPKTNNTNMSLEMCWFSRTLTSTLPIRFLKGILPQHHWRFLDSYYACRFLFH